MALLTQKEQAALRAKVREFLDPLILEAPSSWRGALEDPYVSDENWGYHRKMARKIDESGWSLSIWPAKYGGREAPLIEQIVINEMVGYCKAGGIDVFAGMIGSAIFLYGTEEQKAFHLPKIANGEEMWCLGWSERNAGSDVASLKTRATRQGDHYIVNGQKIWTSNAHRADWMFAMVRTDANDKSRGGVSVLLIDMKTKGIDVRPIRSMNGEHSFNEVYFDDVKVPTRNLLGREDDGWKITKDLMSLERMGMAGEIGHVKRLLDDLTEYCRKTPSGSGCLLDDGRIAERLAELAIEIEVVRALCYELGRIVSEGGSASALSFACALKVSTSEVLQKVAYVGVEILGTAGQVEKGSPEVAPMGGQFARTYQTCVGMNIAGGTSEIQRNVIAWNVLGLPRCNPGV